MKRWKALRDKNMREVKKSKVKRSGEEGQRWKIRSSPDPIDAALLSSLQIITESRGRPEEDSEGSLFGKQIGAIVDRLSPQQRQYAVIKIHELLYNIEFGQPNNVTERDLYYLY